MTTSTYWVVPVAVPAQEVISANHRAVWQAVHRQTVALRERGTVAVRSNPHPRFDHATCWVFVRYPDTRVRRDVANFMGTVKPIIDGMVSARLLPDDDDRYLDGPWLKPWPRGDYPDLDEKCARVFLQLPPTVRWFRFAFCFSGTARW